MENIRDIDVYLWQLGTDKRSAIRLKTGQTTVGRDSGCSVFIHDPLVSRFHAKLSWQGNQLWVHDGGSLNGTFVNGRRVTGANGSHLSRGDELRFGNIRFLVIRGTGNQLFLPPDGLRLDDVAAEVYVHQSRIRLAPKEYSLLSVLWRSAGTICSKEQLARTVWPEFQGIVSDASIEACVSRLRKKLLSAGGQETWIHTVPKKGYSLKNGLN